MRCWYRLLTFCGPPMGDKIRPATSSVDNDFIEKLRLVVDFSESNIRVFDCLNWH